MAVSLKHAFTSVVADGGDTTLVQPSNWNAEHTLTLATARLLGRTTAGTGAAEEISAGTGLSLSSGTLSVSTVPTANGGTGLTSYTTGDILYASAATTLAALADVATGNALISGGVGAAPSWGKIGLTTHISGTLAVGNGGTGQTTYTDGQLLIGNTTGNTLTKATLTAGTNITITNGSGSITIAASGASKGQAIIMAMVFGR